MGETRKIYLTKDGESAYTEWKQGPATGIWWLQATSSGGMDIVGEAKKTDLGWVCRFGPALVPMSGGPYKTDAEARAAIERILGASLPEKRVHLHEPKAMGARETTACGRWGIPADEGITNLCSEVTCPTCKSTPYYYNKAIQHEWPGQDWPDQDGSRLVHRVSGDEVRWRRAEVGQPLLQKFNIQEGFELARGLSGQSYGFIFKLKGRQGWFSYVWGATIGMGPDFIDVSPVGPDGSQLIGTASHLVEAKLMTHGVIKRIDPAEKAMAERGKVHWSNAPSDRSKRATWNPACGIYTSEGLTAAQDPRQVTCKTCRKTDSWKEAMEKQMAKADPPALIIEDDITAKFTIEGIEYHLDQSSPDANGTWGMGIDHASGKTIWVLIDENGNIVAYNQIKEFTTATATHMEHTMDKGPTGDQVETKGEKGFFDKVKEGAIDGGTMGAALLAQDALNSAGKKVSGKLGITEDQLAVLGEGLVGEGVDIITALIIMAGADWAEEKLPYSKYVSTAAYGAFRARIAIAVHNHGHEVKAKLGEIMGDLQQEYKMLAKAGAMMMGETLEISGDEIPLSGKDLFEAGRAAAKEKLHAVKGGD